MRTARAQDAVSDRTAQGRERTLRASGPRSEGGEEETQGRPPRRERDARGARQHTHPLASLVPFYFTSCTFFQKCNF